MKYLRLVIVLLMVIPHSLTAQEYENKSFTYKDGTVESEGMTKMGLEFGRWKYYNKDGQLVQEVDYN
ncbi:MAG: hypothetical protein R6V52_07910, partial [Bacteroidales bacterium]